MRATIRPLWAAYELKCEQRFWGGVLVLFGGDEVVLKDVFGALCRGRVIGGRFGGVLGSVGGIWEVLGRFEMRFGVLGGFGGIGGV